MLLTTKSATSSRNAADDCDADALLVGGPLQHGLGHLAGALLEICDGKSWGKTGGMEAFAKGGDGLVFDNPVFHWVIIRMVISHLRCFWPAHLSR